MDWIAGVSILIFLVNSSIIVWVYRGLKRIEKTVSLSKPVNRSFSVIIAAHNEAESLGRCLTSLVSQDYPKPNYEVVVVADRCTDTTVKTVKQFEQQFSRIKVCEITVISEEISPKKYALDRGIREAVFDHFIFLDADVIPSANHIKILNEYFNEGNDVVVGIMKLELQNHFLHKFLRYERLLNWSVATGGIGNGTPIISYGGNWAYTRRAFEDVNGFEGLFASLGGDDDLVLQKFAENKLKIGFCSDQDGWVITAAPSSVGQFLRQRRRHFAASKFYQRKFKAGYFLYHSTNLLIWVLPFLYVPAIVFLPLKFFANIWLVKKAGVLFKENVQTYAVPLVEFLFMLYNTLIGPLSFFGKLKW